jgi:hypothetical protein
MMDGRAIETELQQARLARMEAEAANSDVEEMILEVQHMPAGRRCFAWLFAGVDPEQLAAN